MESTPSGRTMAPGSKIHLPTGQVVNVGKQPQKQPPTRGEQILQKKWSPAQQNAGK